MEKESSFNLINGSVDANNADVVAGGVYLSQKACFNMQGGSVNRNLCVNAPGGVMVSQEASFTMINGSICGNQANYGTGGIETYGTMTLYGQPDISGNLHAKLDEKYNAVRDENGAIIYKPSDLRPIAPVTIQGMASQSRIGIFLYPSDVRDGPRVLTSGLKDKGNPESFFLDPCVGDLELFQNDDGEIAARVALPPQIDLSRAQVIIPAQTYNGKALSPVVTVKLDGQTLTRDTDYTVSQVKKTAPGSYDVTVTGVGTYTGTAKGTLAPSGADSHQGLCPKKKTPGQAGGFPFAENHVARQLTPPAPSGIQCRCGSGCTAGSRARTPASSAG